MNTIQTRIKSELIAALEAGDLSLRNQAIARLRVAELPIAEIAEIAGVTTATVYRVSKDATPEPEPAEIAAEAEAGELDPIAVALDSGADPVEIAEEHGVSLVEIRKRAQKAKTDLAEAPVEHTDRSGTTTAAIAILDDVRKATKKGDIAARNEAIMAGRRLDINRVLIADAAGMKPQTVRSLIGRIKRRVQVAA